MVVKKDDKKVEVKLDTTKTKKATSKSSSKVVKDNIDVEIKRNVVKANKDSADGLEKLKDLVDSKGIELSLNTNTTSYEVNATDLSVKKYVVKQDALGRSYATGKRKDAVARVWIKSGKGNVTINGKDMSEYFKRPVLQMIVNQPFAVTDRIGSFDCIVTVSGGGLSGQAGAVKHGISKALCNFNPDLRVILKKAGFLTRDARVVERKKFGHAKARRSFQFSKR